MDPSYDVEETHPETFYDIQEETTWTITFLVLIVTLLYVSFFFIVFLLIGLFVYLETDGLLQSSLFGNVGAIAMGAGVGAAMIHALVAYFRDFERDLEKLGAQEIDPDDRYHQVFDNIMEELRIAGNRSNVEGYVLPSKYRTALSLGGRKRSAVVLTEGALSTLDRSELQAVIAHEFAHISYGDTAAKTFLQNIVSSLDALTDFLSQSNPGNRSMYALSFRRSDGGGVIAYVLLLIVTTIYETITRILSMAISKQKEWRADATAVEYSRNPEALASALYKIGFFYDEATVKMPKYVSMNRLSRRNYESLQIVPARADRYQDRGGWFSQLFHTHPPLRKRIERLLDMVGLSFQDLASSVTAVAPTEDYQSNRIKLSDGTPLKNKEFWVEQEGNVTGPVPFPQLWALGMMDGDAKVGGSPDGPMKPLSSLPFFEKLQKQTTSGDDQSCPDCSGPLQKDRYLGAPIEACPVCGGVGTRIKHLARIICRFQKDEDEKDVQIDLERCEEVPHPTEQPKEQKELQVTCPECDNEFNKSFYTGRTSLILDVCSLCGYLWFEHEEFQIACRLSN